MDGELLSTDIVEDVRTTISSLSRVDRPLGCVLSKSLELMSSVMKDGLAAPDLEYCIRSLKSERELAITHGKNKDDLVRKAVYGVMHVLEAMVSTLAVDKNIATVTNLKEAEEIEQIQNQGTDGQEPIDNDDAAFNFDNFPKMEDDILLLVPKDEDKKRYHRLFTSHTLSSTRPNHEGEDDNEPDGQVLPVPPMPQEDPLQPVQQVLQLLQQQMQPVQEPVDGAADEGLVVDKQLPDDVTATPTENSEEGQGANKSARKRHRGSYEESSDREDEGNVADRTTPKAKRRSSQAKVGSAQKTFVCTTCSMAFGRACELAKHMITHTGVKSNSKFACDKCETTFTTTSGLKYHERNVHGSLPYECAPCSIRFGFLHELQEHKVDIHQLERRGRKKKEILSDSTDE